MALEMLVEEQTKLKVETRKPYKTFADIFLEEPHYLNEAQTRYPACIIVPTFCTFKGVPLIDDADELI